MSILDLKPLDRNTDGISTTEFTGVGQEGVIYPKFGMDLSGKELGYVLKGICRAWSKANTSKGIFLTSSVKLDLKSNKEFFDFLLFFWLQRFNTVIGNHLVPVFKTHKESLPFAVGRINFIELEKKLELGSADFGCEYSNISTDIDYLRVLKDGYFEIMKRATSLGTIEKEVLVQVNRGLQIMKSIPNSGNPLSNALNVRSKLASGMLTSQYSKLEPLSETVSFFADFIISSYAGVQGKAGSVKGVIFNMNYLLEYVLRRSLRTLYSNPEPQKYEFANDQINRIIVRSGKNKSFKHMNPDCVGIFSKVTNALREEVRSFLENKVYVFDAKHKTFFDTVSVNDVNRNDFYQLIAYSSTHSNSQNREGIYGLIGIEKETSFLVDMDWENRSYVNQNSSVISIDFDNRNLTLIQVPIKFGQFLFDLGRVEDDQVDLLYSALGASIANEAFRLLKAG